MRVLFVTPELYPLAQTGGLADVGALPLELAALGIDARPLLPGYPSAIAGAGECTLELPLPDLPGGHHGAVRSGRTPAGLPLYLLDAPTLFARPGTPYAGPDGADWPDNHLRFAALCVAAAALSRRGPREWSPDIVHCHDWTTGLTPAYLRRLDGRRPASVMTVHNLAYQGLYDASIFPALGLPASFFHQDGLEFHGKVGFLKAGLYYADRITTVSPSYAREIQTPEGGMGLDGLLRARSSDLVGILNGVDRALWDPRRDSHLVSGFSADRMAGKALGKAHLQREFGLAERADAPVFGVVSRLTHQKGLDLVIDTLAQFAALDAQLVLLGTGDPPLEAAFRAAAAGAPDRIGIRIGYDEALSHRIVAAADFLLVPSRWEPCGLTQLYALRYGTLPVARRVGGLADTIVDLADEQGGTGFLFEAAASSELLAAIIRAALYFRRRGAMNAARRRAMAQIFRWTESARRYAKLYREMAGPAPGSPDF